MKQQAWIHGAAGELPPRRLGALAMRAIPPAERLNITLLHETLPPRAAAPDVTHRRTSELVFVVRGRADGYLDGRRVPLKKGDYLLIPPGTKHRFETAASGVEAVSIFFPSIDPRRPDAVVSQRRGGRRGKLAK